MLMTIKLNNVKIAYTQQELNDLGLSIADGTYKYECILEWIINHKH